MNSSKHQDLHFDRNAISMRFSLSGFGRIHHARFRIWKKEELDRPWINAYRIFVECYLPPQVRAVNHGRYGSFTCKMLYLTAVRL